MSIIERMKRVPIFVKILSLPIILLVVVYLSVVVSFWPKDYFWVERKNAIMPVWVRGNIESGVFIIFNHGGPGSSGTLESIIEVNPANGRFDQESPFKILESRYAMVYWDQRHSGLSKGSADPNDSRPEDFGEDLATVIDELEMRYDVQRIFLIGQSWGHCVAASYMTYVDDWSANQEKIDGYITLLYARYWAARQMYPQAIALSEQLLNVAPDSPYADQLLLLAAECEVSRGKVDRALATLHSLLKDYPGSPLVPLVRDRIQRLESGEIEKPKRPPRSKRE